MYNHSCIQTNFRTSVVVVVVVVVLTVACSLQN